MSTVKLNCSYCGNEFEKSKHEISRRKYKKDIPSDKWYCSRSCSAKSNKGRAPTAGSFKPGKDHRRPVNNAKYDQQFVWYLKRCTYDNRFSNIPIELRKDFLNHIKAIWTGKCCLSDVDIELKNNKGHTKTQNCFQIASLDRINNDKPYEIGNVQWISQGLNLARNNTPLNEFKDHMKVLGL